MPVDPSSLTLRCPKCGVDLWAKRAGEWTLRNAILKLDPEKGQRFLARCPESGCDGLVEVPFLSLVEPPKERPAGKRIYIRQRLVLDATRSP